ncbi:MAG: hypothetical protein IPH18_00035 [Chitinophagaceae bacterium]|nr:hypothetical protein [Chitinophagaceae bacterium]
MDAMEVFGSSDNFGYGTYQNPYILIGVYNVNTMRWNNYENDESVQKRVKEYMGQVKKMAFRLTNKTIEVVK